MKLFHVTNKLNADNIMKKGFSLRKSKNIRINGNGIYLSDKEQLWQWINVIRKDFFPYNDTICVIECDVQDNLSLLLKEEGMSKEELSNDYKKLNLWIRYNKENLIKEIEEKGILKNAVPGYENQEALGYATEKYAKENGFDGAKFIKFYRHPHTNEKIITSSETVIYNPENIKPISYKILERED